MSERVELADTTTGRWQVLTEGSAYLVDLDARTVTRQPGYGVASALRRDGDPVPLLTVAQLRVGKSGMLLLDVRGDGVPTMRQTSLVTAIHPADDTSTSLPATTVDPLPAGFFFAMPAPLRGRLEAGWAKWIAWCSQHHVHPIQADVGQVVDHLLDRKNVEAGRRYAGDEDDVADGLDAITAVLRYRTVNPVRSDPRLIELRGQL